MRLALIAAAVVVLGTAPLIFLLGDVEGNDIKGTFSVAEMRGDWTGKKK
jgi:hypothetical protein